MSPANARARLTALRSERLDAAETGLAGNPRYVAQLDADIAASETAYVLLAVGEIASLRADLDGELVG
jgi:hypothetical protein